MWRRLGVRLSKSKKPLALHAHNGRAVDPKPLPTCAHTSAEACAALQAELKAAGSPCSWVHSAGCTRDEPGGGGAIYLRNGEVGRPIREVWRLGRWWAYPKTRANAADLT